MQSSHKTMSKYEEWTARNRHYSSSNLYSHLFFTFSLTKDEDAGVLHKQPEWDDDDISVQACTWTYERLEVNSMSVRSS